MSETPVIFATLAAIAIVLAATGAAYSRGYAAGALATCQTICGGRAVVEYDGLCRCEADR